MMRLQTNLPRVSSRCLRLLVDGASTKHRASWQCLALDFLTHFRQLDTFEQVSGLCLGRFHPAVGLSGNLLDSIVLRATRGTNLPVAVDLDFGHVDPMFVLPVGARARLQVDQSVQLTILERAVATQ
jgi:hypothetical protein